MRACVNKENKEAVEAVETLLINKKIAYEKLESLTFKGTIVFDMLCVDIRIGVACMEAGASTFSR